MTPTSPPDPSANSTPSFAESSEKSSALAWRDSGVNGSAGTSKEMVRARAEEDTTRELYARLINMLSQEGGPPPEPVRHSPLEGVASLLRRRWLPMLLIFGLSALTLSRVIKPGPPTFSATASMLLPPVGGPGKGTIIDDGSDTVARQYDTDAQIAIITAPDIVVRSVAKLTRAQKIAGWGSDKIRDVPVQASALTSQNIIDITVTSLNVNSSKALANTVGGIYVDNTRQRTGEARQQDAASVQRQANKARAQLEAAQNELRDYKQRTGINNPASAISASEQSIQELSTQAEAARAEASAGLNSQTITSDGSLASLRQAAASARATLEALSVDRQPTSSPVVKARQAYEAAQAQADARVSTLLESLRRRAQTTSAQLEEARSRASSLPQVESQLNRLQGNVERLNATYNTVSQRLGAANLSLNAYIAVPTFLRPATPDGRVFGERAKYLALSILGALVLSSLVGMLLERLDRGVHSVDDLRDVLDVPVLGSLPALGFRSEARLTHMSVGRNGAAIEAAMLEASHKLRSRLVEEAYKNGVRSLLITAASAGDGKSLCALNVAAALAFDGHRVLLIDTDFWNPTQHKLAGVPLSPGYSDVLGASLDAESAMRPSNVRNLWILPSGGRPANIGEMVASRGNQQQIKSFGQSFDFVIIDSPPTLTLADAQILSSLSDAVALVIADSTSREEVRRAESLLRLTGAHLLGVVLNGDRSRSRSGKASTTQSSTPTADVGDGSIGRLPGAGRAAASLDAPRD